jgi:hypothetical protein
MKVKNINPAPHYNCNCGNWLKHWEKFGTKKAPHCAVPGCEAAATLGAHMQKADSTEEDWYVAPLCQEHSTAIGELEIWEGYKLVSANVELTCERW